MRKLGHERSKGHDIRGQPQMWPFVNMLKIHWNFNTARSLSEDTKIMSTKDWINPDV